MYCGIEHFSADNLRSDVSKLRFHNQQAAIAMNLDMLDTPGAKQIDLNLLVWCRKGCTSLRLDFSRIELNAGEVLIVPEHSIVSDLHKSSDLDCVTILFTTELAHALLNDKLAMWENMLFRHTHRIVRLNDTDRDLLEHYASLLAVKIDMRRSSTYFPKSMDIMLSTLFLEMLHIFTQAYPESSFSSSLSREEMLFTKFITCVWNQNVKRLTVKNYADMLCVTSKYLTTVCKAQSNHSAQYWIKTFVLRDLRIYFTYTDLKVIDVSQFTGFDNQSFFCKFFKKYFHSTPTQYRLQSQIMKN